jgi:hypothetical protein
MAEVATHGLAQVAPLQGSPTLFWNVGGARWDGDKQGALERTAAQDEETDESGARP